MEKILDKFDKEFRCISPGCDNNGTIGVMGDNGDVEAEQCQFCDQVRLPIKNFISQELKALLEEIIKEKELLMNGDYPEHYINSGKIIQIFKSKGIIN